MKKHEHTTFNTRMNELVSLSYGTSLATKALQPELTWINHAGDMFSGELPAYPFDVDIAFHMNPGQLNRTGYGIKIIYLNTLRMRIFANFLMTTMYTFTFFRCVFCVVRWETKSGMDTSSST